MALEIKPDEPWLVIDNEGKLTHIDWDEAERVATTQPALTDSQFAVICLALRDYLLDEVTSAR